MNRSRISPVHGSVINPFPGSLGAVGSGGAASTAAAATRNHSHHQSQIETGIFMLFLTFSPPPRPALTPFPPQVQIQTREVAVFWLDKAEGLEDFNSSETVSSSELQ